MPQPELPPAPPKPAVAAKAPPAKTSAARPAAKVPSPPALAPIDRRTTTRLGRGSVTIDARIDLHGMTQATAHGRLKRFLREGQARGNRLVLVITGKGRPGGGSDFTGDERGVLRRLAPMWLSSPEMRPFVVGFGEAGPAHGGAGALYVRLRRSRGQPH